MPKPMPNASRTANKGVFAVYANRKPASIRNIGINLCILSKSISVNDIKISPEKRTRYFKLKPDGIINLLVKINFSAIR